MKEKVKLPTLKQCWLFYKWKRKVFKAANKTKRLARYLNSRKFCAPRDAGIESRDAIVRAIEHLDSSIAAWLEALDKCDIVNLGKRG